MKIQEYLMLIKKVYDEVILDYYSKDEVQFDDLFKEVLMMLLLMKDDSYENIYDASVRKYLEAVMAISKLSPGFSSGIKDAKNDIALNIYLGKKSDIPNDDAIDENTVFDASSMTKMFTSIFLLHEQELGNIDLNRTFAEYSSLLKNLNIPIKEALRFGFNISTDGRVDEAQISNEERLNRLFNSYVKEDNTFIYSDIPYMLVPLTFGKTLKEAINNYLEKFYKFYRDELGLQNTGYSFINATGGSISSNYNKDLNKFEYIMDGVYDPKAKLFEGQLGYISGHAGITTNIFDLEKLFDFLNNGLLSSESLKDLVTSVRPGEKILLDDEGIPVLRGGKKVNVNRGMGVYINLGDIRACDISSRCSASAFAAEGSTGTYCVYDLENGFSMTYLSNVKSGIYSKFINTNDYVYGDDSDEMPKYYGTTLISGTGTMKDGQIVRPDGTYMTYVRATNNFKEESLNTLLKLRIVKNVLVERAKVLFDGQELNDELEYINKVFNGDMSRGYEREK